MTDQFSLVPYDQAEVVVAEESETSMGSGSSLPYPQYKLSQESAIIRTEEEEETYKRMQFIPVYISKKKTFFKDDNALICSSNDAIFPVPGIANPLNADCSSCQFNVWEDKTPPICKDGVILVGIDITKAVSKTGLNWDLAKPFMMFFGCMALKAFKETEKQLKMKVNGVIPSMYSRVMFMTSIKATGKTSGQDYYRPVLEIDQRVLLPAPLVEKVKELATKTKEIRCRTEPAYTDPVTEVVGELVDETPESMNIYQD